jgi:tetratricopeptide (TPR) repeat protein
MSDERLPDLFLEAQDLDEVARRSFLGRIEQEDPELARELARLLAPPASASSPIDAPPLAGQLHSLAAELGVDPPALAVPERVGPFRIVRELGRGGMGRVFLAEQETPDYRRSVALKLIDRPGPDAEAVRRFRDEVRILAALDHQHIVRFLDGGRSPEGIWYLALEYLEGSDLLAHAAARDLDARARVRLLLPVVDAVAFAHQRGVVHRDIKPSNVLVDGQGSPRLLDFGISKLVAGDPLTGAHSTLGSYRPLTPAYASPEQLAGEPASATSDVYSLGVVLYELLVGRRPFPSAPPAGSSSTPVPPSAAARQQKSDSPAPSPEGASPPPRSARRRRRLGADLDAICLKALAVDPGVRYTSAAELAADMRRYLDGRRTLARSAARASWRGGRLTRTPIAWIAAAALVAAVALTFVAIRRGARPGSVLSTPAAAASRGFPFDPTNPPPGSESERRLAEAPDDVVAGAALVLRLARDERMGEARIALGRMRQVPGKELDPILDFAEGRLASREAEDQRALFLYTRARDNALATGRSEVLGAVRTSRASALMKLRQTEAALAELELARLDSERAGDARTLYRTLNGLALERLQRGDMARGRQALEEALVAARQADVEPVVTLENLTVLEASLGHPDRAEPLAREILAIRRRDGDTADEGEILKTLALILRDLGRSGEAAPLLEQSIKLLEASKRGNVLADAIFAAASADLEDGRLDRVDGFAARLESGASSRLTPLAIGYARSIAGSKAALTGDLTAARGRFAEARRLIAGDGYPDLAALSDLSWAWAEARAGNPQAAEKVIADALAALAQPEATPPGYFAVTLRARNDAAAGRFAEARRRLAALGAEAAASPSLSRRIAFLAARGLVAGEEHRGAGGADLDAAIQLARTSGRKVEEVDLRIDRERLAAAGPAPGALDTIAREAEELGLAAIAARARALGAAPRVDSSRL